MSKISPACLQTFNNELIKGLESLKEKHRDISVKLESSELKEQKLQQEILKLQQQLAHIQQDTLKTKQIKLEYATLIQVQALIGN